MKKLFVSAIVTAMIAAPAFAASMTVEFVRDDGMTTVVVLNDDGTTMIGDVAGTYTYDEETLTLCGQSEGADEVCVTFEDAGATQVGDSTGYTSTAGDTGIATITAMTE